MSPKVAISIALGVFTCLASAQNISLEFPDAGDRQVWIASSTPTDPPGNTDGIQTQKSEATLPIGGHDTGTVYVWDRKTGNLASKSVKDASAKAWFVKPGDFQDLAEVSVHVEHLGKPVAAATVDLYDGRHKVTQLLAPSGNGAVTFFDVKPGSLKVTVHYKAGGKDGKPVTQLVDAPLSRTDAIPIATISLADSVDTVAEKPAAAKPDEATVPPAGTAGAKGDAEKSPSKDSGPNIFGTAIIYLLVLCGGAAAIYFGMKYLKANPDSVGSKLEQLGVQIPKPGDDPLTNPAPIPLPKAPAPVQKIMLDNAAPDLIAPAGASTVIADPRLVSQTGDSLHLPEGDLVVGREVGLGLSLVGESTVSRKHAQLTRSGSSVVLKDFGSTNGSFVNGVQVQGEKQLQPGDNVQFGSVRFRFEG